MNLRLARGENAIRLEGIDSAIVSIVQYSNNVLCYCFLRATTINFTNCLVIWRDSIDILR